MVLEYLDGRSVQRELDIDGPFTPARVLHIAKQALHALGAAHTRGLVHRDIKPDNLLLMRQGDDADYTKVLDFGVAKLMEGAATTDRSALAITQAGMVFGTPEFMSPEQACGQSLDGRSDLYSLAVTMFAMLTGCGMFRASSAIEWMTHHVRTPPPHLWDGLPALAPYTALDEALRRCLAKRAADRPQTADEMRALLDSVGTGLAAPSPAPVAAEATLVPLPRQHQGGSSFTQAVQSELVEALAASPPTASTSVPATVRRGRGAWLLVGAIAIAAMVGVTIVVASRGKPSARGPVVAAQRGSSSPSRADAALSVESPPPPAPIDAGGIAMIDASIRPDAAAGVAVAPTARPRVDPEVATHIAAAEAAHRAGNRLRQLAEADAALQADPRNTRARFLAADALLAAGDLDTGCKYLRALGKAPSALARARQAGCPTD
jgi:serine/threonine-protein kinase